MKGSQSTNILEGIISESDFMRLWIGNTQFSEFGRRFNYQPWIVRQKFLYEEEMKYDLSRIPVGVYSDNRDSIFYMNFSKSCRVLVLGGSECLDLSTLLIIDNKATKIRSLPLNIFLNSISYNFESEKLEQDKLKVIDSGIKNVYEIELDSGQKVIASLNHKFFILRNNKITEITLKNLKIGDEILCQEH
jgi:hypothetical protein